MPPPRRRRARPTSPATARARGSAPTRRSCAPPGAAEGAPEVPEIPRPRGGRAADRAAASRRPAGARRRAGAAGSPARHGGLRSRRSVCRGPRATSAADRRVLCGEALQDATRG
jgi:hypothetical protein